MAKYACDPRVTPPIIMLRQNFYGFSLISSLLCFYSTRQSGAKNIEPNVKDVKEINRTVISISTELFSSALQKEIGFCCHDIYI